jgi:hypothetical protein
MQSLIGQKRPKAVPQDVGQGVDLEHVNDEMRQRDEQGELPNPAQCRSGQGKHHPDM